MWQAGVLLSTWTWTSTLAILGGGVGLVTDFGAAAAVHFAVLAIGDAGTAADGAVEGAAVVIVEAIVQGAEVGLRTQFSPVTN